MTSVSATGARLSSWSTSRAARSKTSFARAAQQGLTARSIGWRRLHLAPRPRARARSRPSRRQAGEPFIDRRRPSEGGGLRSRERSGPRLPHRDGNCVSAPPGFLFAPSRRPVSQRLLRSAIATASASSASRSSPAHAPTRAIPSPRKQRQHLQTALPVRASPRSVQSLPSEVDGVFEQALAKEPQRTVSHCCRFRRCPPGRILRCRRRDTDRLSPACPSDYPSAAGAVGGAAPGSSSSGRCSLRRAWSPRSSS